MNRVTVVLAATISAALAGCGASARSSARFEMVEMSNRAAPGLGDQVEVRVGDVREGRVAEIVVLARATGEVLASMRAGEGDAVAFRYDGRAWVVEVLSYVDRELDGDDRAELRIRPATTTAQRN